MSKQLLITVAMCLLASLAEGTHDKWIVVTTIQYPTTQLHEMAQIPGWQLLVIGDKKTPLDWHLDNCIYLSPEDQLATGYRIAKLLPWNHYSRKNIGYLYAIEHGATLIYDTDDDNQPIGELRSCFSKTSLPSLETSHPTINIYAYFDQPNVWPRGFPLEDILQTRSIHIGTTSACLIGIEQGVVNVAPDVDAIFRLTRGIDIYFTAKEPCYLPRGIFCPINSQNTFFHNAAFWTLYLPSHVSFRVADIWRGYIAQRLLWDIDHVLAFSGPNAFQIRNEHCLLTDFQQEIDLYCSSGKFIRFLSEWSSSTDSPVINHLSELCEALVPPEFLQVAELPLVNAWIDDLKDLGYEVTAQKD